MVWALNIDFDLFRLREWICLASLRWLTDVFCVPAGWGHYSWQESDVMWRPCNGQKGTLEFLFWITGGKLVGRILLSKDGSKRKQEIWIAEAYFLSSWQTGYKLNWGSFLLNNLVPCIPFRPRFYVEQKPENWNSWLILKHPSLSCAATLLFLGPVSSQDCHTKVNFIDLMPLFCFFFSSFVVEVKIVKTFIFYHMLWVNCSFNYAITWS